MGKMTTNEHVNKFLELLRYAKYILDEKIQIWCFLGGLPQSYKDRIGFNKPQTLGKENLKAKYIYEHKYNLDFQRKWKDKKKEKFGQRKKGFKPPHSIN